MLLICDFSSIPSWLKKKKRIDIPNISQIIRIFSQKHKKHFYDKAGVRWKLGFC